MATLTEINFNYRRAMEQVAELNDIASDLKKVGSSNLSDCLKTVKNNWKGDNSEAYTGKGEKLKAKILDSAGDISKTAGTLSTMAANIRNAEIKNLETIKTRSASSES